MSKPAKKEPCFKVGEPIYVPTHKVCSCVNTGTNQTIDDFNTWFASEEFKEKLSEVMFNCGHIESCDEDAEAIQHFLIKGE